MVVGGGRGEGFVGHLSIVHSLCHPAFCSRWRRRRRRPLPTPSIISPTNAFTVPPCILCQVEEKAQEAAAEAAASAALASAAATEVANKQLEAELRAAQEDVKRWEASVGEIQTVVS